MKKTFSFLWEFEIPGLNGLLKTMKLTILLLLVSVMSVFANKTYSQTKVLSLNMSNSTVKEVLQNIEAQSEFYFMYSEKLVDVKREVSVNIRNKKINEVLDELFAGTNVNYKVKDRFILLTTPEVDGTDMVTLQQSTVSGKVVDSKGQPLPGVTVIIDGTTSGTITDSDGNYTITNVPFGSTLIFSFVGMKTQEISISGRVRIDITMEEETIGLDEVIAVGYQTQRKADLTGAIGVVKLDNIENVSLSSGNPMQALQGRVPGLLVEKTGTPTGSNSRILIRGVNTLGDNNPLYIIDGVPTKRPEIFQSLSPSSIESVQVLKDASASSIYGSRASNGVIIVTTKDGSAKKGKMNIQFNANYSIQTEKKQRFKMANAVQRGEALWQASVYDHANPAAGYGQIYNFDWNGDYDNPVLYGVTPQPYVGGNTNVPVGDTDWQDASYDPAQVISGDLTISGGTENSSILMNLGYIKNTGMLAYTNYDRITARINGQSSMFGDKLKIGMNTQVATSNETLAGVDLGNGGIPGIAITLAPTIPVYTATGEFAGPIGSGYTDRNNPVHMQYSNRWDVTTRSFFYGNMFAELHPLKNLVLRTTLGVDYSMVKRRDIDPKLVEGFLARTVNNLINYRSDFTSITWSNTANYKLKIEKNTFDFLLGTEAISNDFTDLTGSKQGFASQEESYFVLSAGTSNANSLGTGTGSRLFSQFGKINYNYADKYLASVTLRRDGSSRFGENNRYGFFPALTFGWRINQENFLSDVKDLTNLKLRVGAGRVGNQDIGDFASYALYQSRYGVTDRDIGRNRGFNQVMNIGTAYDINGNDSGNLPSGFVSVQGGNPNLRWEQTDELNIGIDYTLFNGKIDGAFDYFTRKTTDILIQPPIASAVGEGQLTWLNGATKKNNGWEAYISYNSDTKGDFSYNVTASASHFKDKITELPEEVRTAYPGNSEQTIVGHSELSYFGYVTDGIFQNQSEVDAHATQIGAAPGRIRYADLNNDGSINSLDQKFLGTLLPTLEYSLKVDLVYKDFDLSIFGSGVAGKTTFDDYIYYNDFVRARENNGPGVLNGWTPQNNTSKIPAATLVDANNESRTSDFFYVNGSYFKIRNISLGYNLPDTFSKKIGLSRARVYVMGDNLFWVKSKEFKGPDPERQGINSIPVPTTYSAGLNVTF